MMTPKETQAELARFHNDVMYFDAHRDELLKEYPEHYIAIFNEQIVAVDRDYERLLEQVAAKGISLGQVFVDHATNEDYVLILPG
jgi:hypothetical protein